MRDIMLFVQCIRILAGTGRSYEHVLTKRHGRRRPTSPFDIPLNPFIEYCEHCFSCRLVSDVNIRSKSKFRKTPYHSLQKILRPGPLLFLWSRSDTENFPTFYETQCFITSSQSSSAAESVEASLLFPIVMPSILVLFSLASRSRSGLFHSGFYTKLL